MAWIYLLSAAVIEIIFAISIKYSEGFTKFPMTLVTLFLGGMSIFLVSKASQGMPLSTAYTVWMGLGAVGVTIYDTWVLDVKLGLVKWICLALIVGSAVVLRAAHS